jgi:hypothetical protein
VTFLPSQLVKVLSGQWEDALGLVKKTNAEGVWVRLGNGVVITEPADNLEPVEYAPGTGCPAMFPEEFKGDMVRALTETADAVAVGEPRTEPAEMLF